MNVKEYAIVIARETRDFIELLGRHPLAAGLFALLGLAGFLFSIYGFNVDREEDDQTTGQVAGVDEGVKQVAQDLRQTTEDVARVGDGVEQIVQDMHAPCSSPPCWNTEDFLGAQFIGTPQQLVERKLPPPFRKDRGQYMYDVAGCRVNVEYRDGAVSYFEALIGEALIGKGEESKCRFDWSTNYWVSHSPMPNNSDVRVKHIIRSAYSGQIPEVRIASACFDCGNYSDPFLEMVIYGSHAGDFVDLYFTTYFQVEGEEDVDYYETAFVKLRESLRRLGGGDLVETEDHCSRDIFELVNTLGGDMRIESVGMGKGSRAWANSLVCQ